MQSRTYRETGAGIPIAKVLFLITLGGAVATASSSSTPQTALLMQWPTYKVVDSEELMMDNTEANNIKVDVDDTAPPMAIKLLTMLMEMHANMNSGGTVDHQNEMFRVRQQVIPPKRTHGKCGPFKICGPLRMRHN